MRVAVRRVKEAAMATLQAVALVVVAVALLGGLRRGWGLWLRRRGLARLAGAPLRRHARGVPVRVMLQGTPLLLGMRPNRRHRLRADLALTTDRFLIATDRGILADLGPSHGRPFASVRCTGPGRLVIEGDLPRADGRKGLFRFEIVVDDAPGWARDLGPFTQPNPSS